MRNSGVVLMGIETVGGHLSLPATLAQLAQLGITRLLVEAGAQITRAFFEAKRVDCFYWFRAPHAIGGKVPALFENIAGPQGFMHTHTRKLGEDCLDIMEHS